MNEKQAMTCFRRDIDNGLKELPDLLSDNKIITIENLGEYEEYLKNSSTTLDLPNGKQIKYFLFTNGNGWYIPTLIKNLMVSKEINETCNTTISVICSDDEAYDLAIKEGFSAFRVHIPLLECDNLFSVKKQEDYYRLVFVKTVLTYHALMLGYSVIYIDPDMAFIKPSIDKIIEHTTSLHLINNNMEVPGLLMAGSKTTNTNTNVMGVLSTPNNIELFKVDNRTFQANLLRLRNGLYAGTDEDFLVMKNQFDHEKVYYLDQEEFPNGASNVNRDKLMMLHANCVSGLDNKIALLKQKGGWFI
jgi:hypothetical protein